MLKLKKSAAKSWPLLLMLALGRLMTRELVEVVMLKLLPAVPVETLLMLLTEPKPKEEVAMEERFLLASAKTKLLAVKVGMLMLPRAVTERIALPVEELRFNRLMEALEALPAMESWASGVVVLMPMLPPAVTVKYCLPVVEATANTGKVWAEEEACTTKVA